MLTPRHARLALALAACLPALTWAACDQTVSGKSGVLSFRYDVDDQLFPPALTTAAAATMLVDVEVFGPKQSGGATEEAPVLDASSADPTVADVVATQGNRVTIRAKSSGRTEITVRSTLGDDAFDLDVATLAKVDLMAPGVIAPDNPPSKALSDATARFFAHLRDGSNRSLVGYGPLTITADPPGAATFPEATEIGMVPIRLTGEGAVTLTAMGDDPLTIEVVPQEDLTGLVLKGPDTVATVQVDGSLIGVLRGQTADGSEVVGVASVAAVITPNADKCTITPALKLGEGAFEIRGKAVGTCRVEASLGGLQKRYDIEVIAK
ncbi:MAG TPA: pilus assembly protein N-terminal domain-containing protein [Myxococcota bacterium]|nr:pilus assembly protein N-terminal domain-containing protein [Myxococcota bacterium]